MHEGSGSVCRDCLFEKCVCVCVPCVCLLGLDFGVEQSSPYPSTYLPVYLLNLRTGPDPLLPFVSPSLLCKLPEHEMA